MPDSHSQTVCPTCHRPRPDGGANDFCPYCAWMMLDSEEDANAPVAKKSSEALMELPGLRIVEEIARGGMGVVYRAVETSAGREVAVKMMISGWTGDDSVKERFAQEARAMGTLDHPGVLPVYRVGEYHGLPYFSMKLAAGGTLAARLSSYAGDWKAIARLISEIAEAVHHAHQRGLLHRDLKPGNILFDAENRAYVSDFGLVKISGMDSSLTRSVAVLGTPHYLAPEVAERDARAASVASDVWSLGAILYELIAQRLAFQAEGVPALLRKIVEKDPDPLPPAVPRNLATITLKCLRKESHQRYDSARALAEDLRRFLNDEPVAARPVGMPQRLMHWCRRRPSLAVLSLLLVTTAVGGTLLVVQKNRDLKKTLHRALLNEAHAIQIANRVQEQEKGLEAIRKAAALEVTPELEEEAASLLSMAAISPHRRIPDCPEWWAFIPNPDLTLAMDLRQEGVVRIVSIDDMRELARWQGKYSAVESRQCFSPDSTLVMLYNKTSDTMELRNWSKAETVMQIPWGKRRTPLFTPDGKFLAVGSRTGVVEWHDLEAPHLPPRVWEPSGLSSATLHGFRGDGKYLLVRGSDPNLRIFDASNGQQHSQIDLKGEGSLTWSCWHPQALGVVTGSSSGKVRHWAMDGSTSRQFPSHVSQVYSLAIHPEGQLAVTGAYENRNWILDWTSGRIIGMEVGNSYNTLFNQDGSRLFLHDLGQKIAKTFEVKSSRVCRQFAVPTPAVGGHIGKGSWWAAVRPGGRILAIACPGYTAIFDLQSTRFLGNIPKGSGTTLAWTRDGAGLWLPQAPLENQKAKLIHYRFTDQADGSILAERTAEIHLLGKHGFRLCLAEAADRWALTAHDGVLHGSLSEKTTTFLPAPAELPATAKYNTLALSPNGQYAVVGVEDRLQQGVFDLKSGRLLKVLPASSLGTALFEPDGRHFLQGQVDVMHRIEVATQETVHSIRDRQEPGVQCLQANSADGRLLVNSDGSSHVLRHGTDLRPFLRLRHPLPLPPAWLDLSPDGRFLTSSGLGWQVQVWDLQELADAFRDLGIPWRGPSFGDKAKIEPVKALIVK